MGMKSIDVADTRSSHDLIVLFLINSQSKILLNLIQILSV